MKEHNHDLNSKFFGWVKLEAISLFFSMSALALAILDYEFSISGGGLKGLVNLTIDSDEV